VQLVGSLTTYLDNISVSVSIPSSAMVVGNYVLVAIPGGNPRDACVVASWPAGSSGGGGGSKIQDADGDTYLWVEKTADEDKIHGVVKGVEAFLLDDAGILTLAKQSSCSMRSNAEQSIPHDTWTYLTYNSSEYDTQGEVDLANNKIVVKRTGTYLVSALNQIYNMVDGNYVQLMIIINRTDHMADGIHSLSQSMNALCSCAGVMRLTAGDEVEGRLKHNFGAAKKLSQYEAQNYLRLHKLA